MRRKDLTGPVLSSTMRRMPVCRALLVLLLLAAPMPGQASPPSASEDRLRVVATIYPLADLARGIGGDLVEVSALLPAGANPHTFEPTPRQIRGISAAQLDLEVGAGLDAWVRKLVDGRRQGAPLVTLTEGLSLLGEEHRGEVGHSPGEEGHGGDPHVWLDPILVRDELVPRIAAGLAGLRPARREEIVRRAAAVQSGLTRLDAELRAQLQPVAGRSYIAFHSAWRYFGARYELREAATVEPFPGKEVSAREMIQIVESARRSGATALLIEPQFSERIALQMAREFGGRVVVADPFGGPGLAGRDTYEDLLRYNARVLSEALR